MHMPINRQILWWSIAAFVLAMALWRLGTVLTPFLIGAGVAYVMDPAADRLERMGLSRTRAVVVITLIVLIAFTVVLLLIVPTMIRQFAQLIAAAPQMFEAFQSWIGTRFPQIFPADGTIPKLVSDAAAKLSDAMGAVLPTVLSSLGSVIGVIFMLLVVPVVSFYLLLDWDRMVARVNDLLPRPHAETIRGLAREINDSLSGFLRGQATVTLILASFYSLGLMAVGLPFGLVIGVMAAVLSIIPYVGVFIGGVTSVAVAAFSFWNEPAWILAVLAIFVVGQLVEGNYLQPKIIGGHVGLHPVWLMIALAVFGSLFGFVGLVVAVPLGAMLGVLVRFFVERYKESALYTGAGVPPEPAQPTLIELVPRGTVARQRTSALAVREAAIAEVKIEEARQEASDAAREAAEKDGARVAVATVRVGQPGAQGILAHQKEKPQVQSWGGKTPDGTDPNDAG